MEFLRNNFAIIIFLMACGIGFLTLQKFPTSLMDSAVISLWVVDVMLKLFPLILEKKRTGQLDWFSPPLYTLFTSFLAIFRPLFIVSDNWKTEWMNGNAEMIGPIVIKTIVISIVANSAYLFAFYGPIGLKLARQSKKIPAKWNRKRLIIGTVVFALVGILSYLYIISSAGGLSAYINQLGRRRWLLKGKDYALSCALNIPLGIWLLWGLRLSSKKRNKFPLYIIVSLVSTVLVISTLGGRGFILQIMLNSFLLVYYMYKRINIGILLILIIPVAYFLQIYEDIRKSTIIKDEVDVEVISKKRSFIQTVFNNSRGFDRTMVVIDGVPDKIGYQFFSTYLRLITTAIPRKFWPGKPPVSEASVYAPLFGMGRGKENIGVYPAGSTGDFYLQLDFLGVIIGFIVIGIWQRFCHEYLIRRQEKNPAAILLYCFALTTGVFSLRNIGIIAFLVKAIPLIILINFIKVRKNQKPLDFNFRLSPVNVNNA